MIWKQGDVAQLKLTGELVMILDVFNSIAGGAVTYAVRLSQSLEVTQMRDFELEVVDADEAC